MPKKNAAAKSRFPSLTIPEQMNAMTGLGTGNRAFGGSSFLKPRSASAVRTNFFGPLFSNSGYWSFKAAAMKFPFAIPPPTTIRLRHSAPVRTASASPIKGTPVELTQPVNSRISSSYRSRTVTEAVAVSSTALLQPKSSRFSPPRTFSFLHAATLRFFSACVSRGGPGGTPGEVEVPGEATARGSRIIYTSSVHL